MVKCFVCKRPAAFVWWTKALGYYRPNCGGCTVIQEALPLDALIDLRPAGTETI
jgi:hypothetical protein